MSSGKYRYVVQGYDVQTAEGLRMNCTNIDVFADGEGEAVERAKTLVHKALYTVITVIEQDRTAVPLSAVNGNQAKRGS